MPDTHISISTAKLAEISILKNQTNEGGNEEHVRQTPIIADLGISGRASLAKKSFTKAFIHLPVGLHRALHICPFKVSVQALAPLRTFRHTHEAARCAYSLPAFLVPRTEMSVRGRHLVLA